jgi:hypothetical protein
MALDRCFALLNNNFLAAVPWEARAGDLVAVIRGASVPFVVRPQTGKHLLIGDAYVEGIMHGETVGPDGWELNDLVFV